MGLISPLAFGITHIHTHIFILNLHFVQTIPRTYTTNLSLTQIMMKKEKRNHNVFCVSWFLEGASVSHHVNSLKSLLEHCQVSFIHRAAFTLGNIYQTCFSLIVIIICSLIYWLFLTGQNSTTKCAELLMILGLSGTDVLEDNDYDGIGRFCI